jgi:hypothetical protein
VVHEVAIVQDHVVAPHTPRCSVTSTHRQTQRRERGRAPSDVHHRATTRDMTSHDVTCTCRGRVATPEGAACALTSQEAPILDEHAPSKHVQLPEGRPLGGYVRVDSERLGKVRDKLA